MKRVAMSTTGASLLLASLLVASGFAATASGGAAAHDDKKAARPAAPNEGERVFQQNCARCHQSPQGFSPHISGTIVRHMRVRANLSRNDERAILKFLNP